jgi:hypothetical protein
MVNMWEENGKTQRKMVGNINELANVRTKELGDVSAFPTRDSSQDIDIATFAQENEMSGVRATLCSTILWPVMHAVSSSLLLPTNESQPALLLVLLFRLLINRFLSLLYIPILEG